jgi:hypothetical protein
VGTPGEHKQSFGLRDSIEVFRVCLYNVTLVYYSLFIQCVSNHSLGLLHVCNGLLCFVVG